MIKTPKFYEYIELKYMDLSDQINNWLKSTYNKSALNLNSASPYGQIVNVLKELFEHNIIYLKNAVKVLNIDETQNIKVARYTARIAGHNPSRAISATGTLKFTLKPGLDISKEIKDSIVVINDQLVLKNKTNSLKYSTNLNVPSYKYQVSIDKNTILIPIIQGSYESQSFTANGQINQSFSVNIPGYKQVENFNYTVSYNSMILKQRDHLYDILPAEMAYYTRSGFNGGIDIYFGNGSFGFIPQNGGVITVNYLLSDGESGIIFNSVEDDWKIEGDVTDGQGNILDVSNLFSIKIENDVNFGSDGETLEFTKAAVPYVSRNFVLGTPNQFIYHLRKLNMFTKINAYTLNDTTTDGKTPNFSISDTVVENSIKNINDAIQTNKSRDQILATLDNFNYMWSNYKTNMSDNEIYLYLIPKISKYFSDTVNYFNIDYGVFYLDQSEQDKILAYLRQLGTLSMTTEIKFVKIFISRYIMHVFVNVFDYADEETVRQQIISSVSDYLLTNNRFDRIPNSDFVRLIKGIYGVDSATIHFVSEKNEKYHKDGINLGYEEEQFIIPKYQSTKFSSTSSQFKPKPQPVLSRGSKIVNGIVVPNLAYNPNVTLGIDTTHGDIICDRDEYAVIRGKWSDRNGIFYNDNMDQNSPCAININIKKIVK